MLRGSFIKASFWLLLVTGVVSLSISGCDGILGFFTGDEGGDQNHPPTLEIDASVEIKDKKIQVNSGEKFTIFISQSSDPDGDQVTISWKIIDEDDKDLTNLLKISDDLATFTAPVVKETTNLTLTIEADDGKGGKAKVLITIIVEPLGPGEAIFILDDESVEIPLPTDGTATATVKATALTKDNDTDEIVVDSKNESVATVKVEKKEESGSTHLITITAKDVGETDLFLTADSTKETKTIHVTVFKEGEAFLSLGGVSVVNVVVAKTVEVQASAKTGDGKDDEIKATSPRTDIATVEVIGSIIRITGVDAGGTDVTVESILGQLKKKLVVNVTKAGEPTLTVDAPELLFIPLGEKKTLNVTTTKADGSPDSVSATPNPTGIATISLSGSSGSTFTFEVNGAATGDATITFESGSKLTELLKVKVDVAPILLLDRTDVTIVVGNPSEEVKVIAAIDAAGKADAFTAQIDPPGSVATISVSEYLITITPVAEGLATITVKLGSDPTISETIAVNVLKAGTVIGPVSEDDSTVVASSTLVSGDGVSTSAVTVTLKDSNNILISGHSVSLSSGTHVTTISPTSVTTDTGGQAVFEVKSTQDGTAIITATDTTESVTLTGTASIAFTDAIPPGDVTSFTATGSDTQVSQSWTNPSDSDFAGILILRQAGSPVSDSPIDGTSYSVSNTIGSSVVVYNSPGASHTDTGLTNNTTYHYKAFAYDEAPNYSPGKVASATPVLTETKLTASDPEADDRFGYSVAIDGDTAVVGAYFDDDGGTNSGSAYVFVWDGSTWSQQAKLTSSNAAAGDEFGFPVSIDGNTIVVGARWDDDAGFNSGAAYVFVRPEGGWTDSTQDAKLTASDATGGEGFGGGVSINGDTIVVGAYRDDDAGTDSGSAYVFVRPEGGWTDSSEDAKLTASDAAAGDLFGLSVPIDGDTIVVGAHHDSDAGSQSGSAYVFVRPEGGWTDSSEDAKLTASNAAAGDLFGRIVSIDGDTIVVGAALGDSGVSDSGSAYVFVKNGSTWSQQAKLTASDAAANDEFGVSVSIDGNTIVVGSRYDDDGGTNSGSAYVFVWDGSTWSQQAKLTSSDATVNDEFGLSVSISGNIKLVGAPFEDTGGTLIGSAYVFE